RRADPGSLTGGRRGAKNGLAQLLRWMPRHHLELAAIFEQFREPLLQERQRRVAERGGDLLADFAAGVPFLAAVDVEQLLRQREVGRVVHRRVDGEDAAAGVPDA